MSYPFNEQQIVTALNALRNGVPVSDVCKLSPACDQTIRNWKARYAGMSMNQIRKARKLQAQTMRRGIVMNRRFGLSKCKYCHGEFRARGSRHWVCDKCKDARPLCACGCGRTVSSMSDVGHVRRRRFISGHNGTAQAAAHSVRMKKLWNTDSYVARQVRSRTTHPNKLERQLDVKLRAMFPGEFKLNVIGDVVIGGKVPDFINVNGKKLLVELFGNYWHGKAWTGRTKAKEEAQRRKHFAKWGFRTAIIWEHEIGDNAIIIERVGNA